MGLGISSRWNPRRASDRPLRSAGLCLRRPALGGQAVADARSPRPRERPRPRRANPPGALRARLLVRGAVDVRTRAGRRQASLPGARLQRRPLPLHRDRQRGARKALRGALALRRILLRLGDPHPGDVGGPLQPDVLSQWLRLASRQLPDCRWDGPVWLQAVRAASADLVLRSESLHGPATDAGALLRLRAPAR